ncbi:hypothetical protein Scep_010059 [Stephania cephalantha]|uniref:non-specific serine/threonine protein kinase n=1 Tax=Stephania cephalantha TaxID=152367 RepID=A0AAP0PD08_9MAGN
MVPRAVFDIVADQLRKVMAFMHQQFGMTMDEAQAYLKPCYIRLSEYEEGFGVLGTIRLTVRRSSSHKRCSAFKVYGQVLWVGDVDLLGRVMREIFLLLGLESLRLMSLKAATRNFRPESILGEGGFGCVFKGWIEENGAIMIKLARDFILVKTLNHDGLRGHKECQFEVNFLGDLLHPNLVKLIGYCIEDDQRSLVYEFMPVGAWKTTSLGVSPFEELLEGVGDGAGPMVVFSSLEVMENQLD